MKREIINDEFISRLESIVLNMKGTMRGFFGGNHKTDTYGSTVEFADFREYVLGDDLRRIDWNLYSRFEKHFIKLFIDERQMHNQLYLDCSLSMKQTVGDKSHTALQAAAALGYLSVQNLDKLSVKLVHDAEADDMCGTIIGKDAFFQSLNQLETANFKGSAQLSKAIQSSKVGHNDGLSIIISDFLTDDDWKSGIDYLLYHKREVMVIQVLSPDELTPTYSGRMILLDSEATDKMDSKNMKLRIGKSEFDAYRQALDDYIASIKQFCRSRNVSYALIRSDVPVEKTLFEQLYETVSIK